MSEDIRAEWRNIAWRNSQRISGWCLGHSTPHEHPATSEVLCAVGDVSRALRLVEMTWAQQGAAGEGVLADACAERENLRRERDEARAEVGRLRALVACPACGAETYLGGHTGCRECGEVF